MLPILKTKNEFDRQVTGCVNVSITHLFRPVGLFLSVGEADAVISCRSRHNRGTSEHLSATFDPGGSPVTTPRDRPDSGRETDPPPPSPIMSCQSKAMEQLPSRKETVELIYGLSAKFSRAGSHLSWYLTTHTDISMALKSTQSQRGSGNMPNELFDTIQTRWQTCVVSKIKLNLVTLRTSEVMCSLNPLKGQIRCEHRPNSKPSVKVNLWGIGNLTSGVCAPSS